MKPRVHQILATLGYGDAIGNEVLGICRTLRAAGYESEIIVETADPRLEDLTVDYQEIASPAMIHGEAGRDLFAHGRVWIEAQTGRVLKTELQVEQPVIRAKVTTTFRMDPRFDIAVPSGTPVRASAAGTVAFTQPEAASGGYGNYTCINHGGGISTCYAHQASFSVSAGQHVSQGQVIGISDCTGHCFGPHVHFEVRVNGVPTDPMAYL